MGIKRYDKVFIVQPQKMLNLARMTHTAKSGTSHGFAIVNSIFKRRNRYILFFTSL